MSCSAIEKEVAVSPSCPPFPEGGSAVKAELNSVCPILRDESGREISTCPAIDEYNSRLLVFKRQIKVSP